jgi:trehalose 6-phosphate phosphatase
VKIDKGAGIAKLLTNVELDNALYVGDDVTDLDAFRTLAQMVQDGRLKRAIRVGVRSDEGPSEIISQADIVVDGTSGVEQLLSLLAAD